MEESSVFFIAENATLLREASRSSTGDSYDPEQHLLSGLYITDGQAKRS